MVHRRFSIGLRFCKRFDVLAHAAQPQFERLCGLALPTSTSPSQRAAGTSTIGTSTTTAQAALDSGG
jgi:hypothetical protein